MTFFDDVFKALYTRFGVTVEDVTANNLAGRVQYGGFDPQPAWDGKRWARLTVDVAAAAQVDTNGTGGRHEHSGILFMEFYDATSADATPGLGDGDGPLRRLCDAAANSFRSWAQDSPQIVTGSPTIGQVTRDRGWLRCLVRVEFQAYAHFVNAT
jgi:hypothetical protein